MKKAIIYILLCLLILSSCHADVPPPAQQTDTTPDTAPITAPPITTVAQEPAPESNSRLFEYIISKWKQNETAVLYEYASSQLASLMDEADFAYLFDSVSLIGGSLNKVSDKSTRVSDGITIYSALLDFDNVTAELTIGLKDVQICSFVRNVHFKDTFELERGDGIVEKYFVLENDGYKLNAVYTYANDAKVHPAVLLIPGSGPADYNSTIGLLAPFEDMALGLARCGINSLRVDKRTLNYSSETGSQIGIEQEYLSDCTAAINFLKKQNISELYLLGHSMGGQIATELAANDADIGGLILFNSSPRHLADIACDQYSVIDPANKNSYRAYADAAKSVAENTIKGYYYYSSSDTYWASYNNLNTAQSISAAGISTLIINSTYDSQLFDDDIRLWKELAASKPNVTLSMFDDISHFGYIIDIADPSVIYRRVEFPEKIIKEFSDFINGTR